MSVGTRPGPQATSQVLHVWWELALPPQQPSAANNSSARLGLREPLLHPCWDLGWSGHMQVLTMHSRTEISCMQCLTTNTLQQSPTCSGSYNPFSHPLPWRPLMGKKAFNTKPYRFGELWKYFFFNYKTVSFRKKINSETILIDCST